MVKGAIARLNKKMERVAQLWREKNNVSSNVFPTAWYPSYASYIDRTVKSIFHFFAWSGLQYAADSISCIISQSDPYLWASNIQMLFCIHWIKLT